MASLPDKVSLTQASRFLDCRQHRLIYLCEQQVVRPEHGDAEGRGSSRRFSTRNLLEFAISLRLRELQLPQSALLAVVRLLHVCEKRLKYGLPEGLLVAPAPDLRILIPDGEFVYASLRTATSETPALFYDLDAPALRDGDREPEDLEQQSTSMTGRGGGRATSRDLQSVDAPDGAWRWRVEIRVTCIAQETFGLNW